MAVGNRYQPPHPPGQTCNYGIDMSAILPPGVGIQTVGGLVIQTNTTPPGIPSGITASGGGWRGRRGWITVAGGVSGTDYILTWTLTDTLGNIWVRTFALLCALTS